MMLKIISNAIINRFKLGYYPTWKFEIIDIEEKLVSDSSLTYIAQKIEDGYTFGEIIENDFEKGYWKLLLQKD